MAERMDVIAFKKGANGKAFAIRCGSAVPNREGPGYRVYLDSIPAPEEGQWVLSIVPPRATNRDGNRRDDF
jgi:hypothetical protein